MIFCIMLEYQLFFFLLRQGIKYERLATVYEYKAMSKIKFYTNIFI